MIDILCPTRNRPEKLKRMLESLRATVSDVNDIHVILYIDEDDSSYNEGIGILPHITIIQGEQQVLSECWNACYKKGTGEILMHCSDDIIFESKDWDIIVKDYFLENDIGLIYGIDGHQDENCPTHSFTSRKAAKKLGYFVPPYFEADWNDVWLRELYKGNSRYDERIIIRHMHVNEYPEENDSTYEISKERRKRASLVWEEKKHLIEKDKEKLCELV